MNYNEYRSEEEYERALEVEHAKNPDTLFHIVCGTKYMCIVTGLAQRRRDFELRYGVPNWKRYGVELESRAKHPIFFPAGKPLTTTKEIITYRNKISKESRNSFILKGFDVDKVEDDTFRQQVISSYEGGLRLRNFRDAYNYSMGKSVNLPHSNINIKADSNGIPQLQKWG